MKHIISIFASMTVIAMTAASCQQFEIDTQMTPEKYAASVKLVSDVQESYTVSAANPQSIIFNVTSNAAWTISGIPEWLTVSPFCSGASGLISDVTIKASVNENLEERTATLKISNDEYDTKPYTFTITQNRMGKLTVQPVYETFKAVGGTLNFTVDANNPWKVTSSEAWLSFDKASGEAGQYTLKATAIRSDVMERTATVTVTSGDDEEKFQVSQKGEFELTAIAEKFGSGVETKSFQIITDLSWKVISSASWLSFDKTEGTGDGSAIVIAATTTVNKDANRTAEVTVKAGDAEKTFEVMQSGFTLEIVAPEDNKVSGRPGELLLAVDANVDWDVMSVDGSFFAVEKVDASTLRVMWPWNGKFVERTATVAISGPNGAEASLELTQECNFTFSGKCTVLEDGSVKIDGSEKSFVELVGDYRYIDATLTFGDKNFGASGQCWFWGALGGVNIYNQLSLGGNTRIRTDGNCLGEGGSAYKSSSYSISQDELNAMDTYEWKFYPNADDATKMDMSFLYNNVERKSHTGVNPYYYDKSTTTYKFGMYSAVSDGTWYIVRSCDVFLYAE